MYSGGQCKNRGRHQCINGISPNGDGDNDYFHIDCLNLFPGNNVKIFNRAGAVVYEADLYDNLSTFFEGHGNRGLYIGGKDLPEHTSISLTKETISPNLKPVTLSLPGKDYLVRITQ